MNEQDFIKKIDEQTKNIEVPDSISPANMKKMLDEHTGKWNTFNDNNIDNKLNSTDSSFGNAESNTRKRKQLMRRFTVAACVALCLVGSVTAIQLSNRSMEETAKNDSININDDDTDLAEEAVAESEETKDVTSSGEELVSQSCLQSPSSYDAYYETLTNAYQAYYDSLATVTNEDTFLYENSVADSVDGEPTTEAAAAIAESDVAMKESAPLEDSASASSASGNRDLADSAADNEKLQANKEFSSTNTQEKNVDEGDIIKTDGTYIYKVASKYNNNTGYTDQTLTITETDNGNLKALSTIDLSGLVKDPENIYVNFHEFYLYKDYILLMYTKSDYTADNTTNETNIVIYNVKDKENPKKMKTLTQSGWYESSRISDGYLYTISNFNEVNLDTPTPYTNYIPSINGRTVECSDIYYPRDILMQTTYVVTSLDLNHPQDFADTKAIPTNGGQTYVSDSSIYFFTTLYDEVTKTEITKVNYDKGTLTPGESATIAGYLYGSFALSEYNGHLRIVATIPANNISLLREVITTKKVGANIEEATTDDVAIKEDVNVLYILDKNMRLTGKLSGIAPGEQIYSARFMGDIGYFVTFKNVDPLFSVDLSDPANPKILGQLKIPGFSNYLHIYEDGLLLGLGEEIDANTSEFLGLKLSMFDVSDPGNVSEQDKYIIENSAYAEAQHNHKALMIDPQKNIFGFLYSSMNETDYRYTNYYVTYTYDKKEGFIETARYKINDDSEYRTNAVRGIYIGDYLYIATNKSITSYEIGSTEPISQVYFK